MGHQQGKIAMNQDSPPFNRFVMLIVTITTVLFIALLVMKSEIKRREQRYRVWQQEHFRVDDDSKRPELSTGASPE